MVITGLILFCLCACMSDIVPDGNAENPDDIHAIDMKTADAEEFQESNYTQCEQSAIDPLCINHRCSPVCKMLYIDGEYVPLCDIQRKYEFFFFDEAVYIGDIAWDGAIIANWWQPEDTSPATSQTLASDVNVGLFVIQDDRIILEEDDGRICYGYAGIPAPRMLAREVTTTHRDEWGIQIFQYAGDVAFISLCGVLSQMSELVDDNFRFPLYTLSSPCHELEIQYILYHELPDSSLWSLLMG